MKKINIKHFKIKKPDIKGAFHKLKNLKKEDIKEYYKARKERRKRILEEHERVNGHIGTETRPKLLREAAVGNIAQWGKP